MPRPTACRLLLALLPALLLFAAAAPATAQRMAPHSAVAQTVNDTYALRRELLNDSYVWEPMLKRGAPQSAPLPGMVNPAGQLRQSSGARPGYGVHQASAAEQSVMRYFGKPTAGAAPAAPRRFVSTAELNQPVAPRPFEHTTTRPTVSAYMNLFREEFEEDSPNYHAFVRPRLEQQQALKRQQVQLDRLERQNRRPAPSAPRVSSAAAAGGASRYGDTGQFYNTWVR